LPFDSNPTKQGQLGLPFSLRDVENALAINSLYEFSKLMWSTVEPGPYIDNWHISVICDHLEAVTKGTITRLLICIPPRCMKSLLTRVFWPAWDWLHCPQEQFLTASYAHTLSIRDNVRCRRLIMHPRYQELMRAKGLDMKFTDDQNTKIRFENNKQGYMIATSVGGTLTGEGGSKIIIDDPHNVVEGESEAAREECLQWWDLSMSSRLNNPRTGAFVVIGQRVHQND
jgi:hypothetical protein